MRDYLHAITLYDLLLGPIYIFVVYFAARMIQLKNMYAHPYYKYFTGGLMVKVFAGISLCLIYEYYYNGVGDTMLYYHGSSVMKDLFWMDYQKCLHFVFSPLSNENTVNTFSNDMEIPPYIDDTHAFFVIRVLVFVNILSFDSFIAMTVIMATISFSGIWRLFLVFINEFPGIKWEMAISILFIPSVFFWGSGLLKDSLTISAVGWYTYAFYFGLIKRNAIVKNLVYLFIASFVMIAIKPYIFIALMPGSIIWLFTVYSSRIKNRSLKRLVTLFFVTISLSLSYFILEKMGEGFGKYSIEKVLSTAVATQQDLKQDYYKGHSFDIGSFDGSISGMLTIAPLAINAALFRPYLWEIRNPVMLISGLENTFILWITFFLLVKLKFIGFFKYIGMHPLLLFSFLFALFFAFSVGLSISNFGALVRLKIPCMPFYVAGVFIIRDYYLQNKIAIAKQRFWEI
jgi:hypothetical protein